MTRQAVRVMKRAIDAGARAGANDSSVTMARQSALSLLSRSIGFGHGRLAVIRLGMAVRIGATVPAEHWRYCHPGGACQQGFIVAGVVPVCGAACLR